MKNRHTSLTYLNQIRKQLITDENQNEKIEMEVGGHHKFQRIRTRIARVCKPS